MSSKLPAILVGVSMLGLTGGIVGFAVYSTRTKSPVKASAARSAISIAPTTQNQPGTTLGMNSGGAASLQSNLGMQGNGAGTSSSGNGSSSNATAQTLTPDQFSAYEEYKDKPSAMYQDIKIGTGTEVASGTKVAITYKGWLTDGTLFDESQINEDGKLQALTFNVGSHEVIVGMEQAIVGMKVGGTRRMIIPAVVGYGAQAQAKIPANSLLVFDVVLHDAL